MNEGSELENRAKSILKKVADAYLELLGSFESAPNDRQPGAVYVHCEVAHASSSRLAESLVNLISFLHELRYLRTTIAEQPIQEATDSLAAETDKLLTQSVPPPAPLSDVAKASIAALFGDNSEGQPFTGALCIESLMREVAAQLHE